MPFRYLILDLGGVFFSDGVRALSEALALELGTTAATVRGALHGAAGERYRRGQMPATEFWWHAATVLVGPGSARKQIAALAEALPDRWHAAYRPLPAMVELVSAQRRRGVRVFYLSDNTPERVAFLEQRYQFSAHFDGGVYSFELGVVKPDLILYERVIALCGRTFRPNDALYVDDKPTLLGPATALGMRVHAFSSPAALRKAIEDWDVGAD